MKSLFSILLLCFVILLFSCKKSSEPTPTSNSFTVTINNGYGSGTYSVGDTVHIFTIAYPDNQLFDAWSGNDVSLLNGQNEWHTWFVMPNHNTIFTGSLKTATTFTLTQEEIMGRDRLKPVYYYFPVNYKGIVYLLHGTNGSAQAFTSPYRYEEVLAIRALITDGFAVVVTEAEEVTTGVDADGNGSLQWATTPYDSVTNVDYANIRIITDTLYNRGIANRSKPRYSLGMSNGGNFSTFLSTLYSYKAGISYCAPSGTTLAKMTSTPLQFCMAQFDNNPQVGPQGDAMALANSQTLKSDNICSNYLLQTHSPLYAERFARSPIQNISITQSTNLFNELKANGYLSKANYFIGTSSDAFAAVATGNTSSYPVFNSLTALQQQFVLNNIDNAIADHQFFSDYNTASLKFLNTQCK